MTHFVYRLTYVTPTDSRRYYYGKHSGFVEDMGQTYFTSSKKVKEIFANNKEAFTVKIIKRFDNAVDAIRYEGLLHRRLNVQDNPLFFNEQNQSANAGLDRTGRVSVIDNITGEKLTISTQHYYENISRYDSPLKCHVLCVNTKDGKPQRVSQEEFNGNSDLIGINKGFVFVTDNDTGEKVRLTKEFYHTNKDLYTHPYNGQVSCLNKITGEKIKVTKEEFDKNDTLVGVNKGKDSPRVKCKYCSTEITVENIKAHERSHETKEIYVTDFENTNTIKVFDSEFYIKYYITHYKVEAGMYTYIDGARGRRRKSKTGAMTKQECPVCGKMIGNTSNFNRHIQNHKG